MRSLFLAMVAVMVIGCSTAGASGGEPTASGAAATPTAGGITESPTTAPEPSRPGEAPVSVTGDPVTGASASFALAGGSYNVDWTTTADTAGCYFVLVLSTKVDGPTVENDVKLLREAKLYSGTFLWAFVPAGTYVLQQDKSGFAACKGPWSATMAPWVPAPSS